MRVYGRPHAEDAIVCVRARGERPMKTSLHVLILVIVVFMKEGRFMISTRFLGVDMLLAVVIFHSAQRFCARGRTSNVESHLYLNNDFFSALCFVFRPRLETYWACGFRRPTGFILHAIYLRLMGIALHKNPISTVRFGVSDRIGPRTLSNLLFLPTEHKISQ